MADEDAQTEGNSEGDVTPAVEVDIEFVDALPDGRAVMAVESEGRFVWLAVRGHVSPQAREEMLSDLRYIVRAGLWQQNWLPPQAEPH
ncbi:hypothetical protein ACFZCL_04425 [Streptomyces sp. NPDC008159]|uniref:hypothetical protein n=1 Tax=Streptomyces sp. NPDC008159 TaxID=3364817 RepID=UPI0036E678D2